MKPTPKFSEGDLVQSAPESSDVTLMERLWIAEVIEVRQGVEGAPDGCCYITVGRWSDDSYAAATSRQLWSNHLTLQEGAKS